MEAAYLQPEWQLRQDTFLKRGHASRSAPLQHTAHPCTRHRSSQVSAGGRGLQMRLFLCLLLVAAASAACPRGFHNWWGFNPYQDMVYGNRGRTYMVAQARARCRLYPSYMHDLLNFGARFTGLCANNNDDTIYSFSTPDPCRGGQVVNGTMALSAEPRRCAKRSEVVGRSWDQMDGEVWVDSAQMPAVRCPVGYRAANARDAPALRAVLDNYFFTVAKAGVQLGRYDPELYCYDAFRFTAYSAVTGCVSRTPAARTIVLAQAVIHFGCFGKRQDRRIGLRTPGEFFYRCPRTVSFKW